MSGVVSGIGKIFKDTVVKPFKESIKIGNEVKDYVMKSPILKAIVIAVAVYFTAGAALAYFGAAGAATAGAAADAAAATDVAGGATIGDAGLSAAVAGGASDAAATAAISGGAAVGADAATTAGAGILAADGAATAATAGTAADALSVGGSALSGAGAMSASEGLTAASGSGSFFTGQAVTANALASGVDPATAAGYGASSSVGNASDTVMAQAGSTASNAVTFGDGSVSAVQVPSMNVSDLAATDTMPTVDATGVETSGNFMTNSVSNVEQWAKGLFGGGSPATTAAGGVAPSAAPATSSLLGDTTKMMLVQGGLQVASALLNKPQPQMQEAGVNSRGTGGGDMISATPGGFGLQMGGTQPVPGGVPIALQPKSPVAANAGMTASNYNASAAVNSGVQSVNLAQNVAASAGVGGLVPQGSGTPGATAALAPTTGAA